MYQSSGEKGKKRKQYEGDTKILKKAVDNYEKKFGKIEIPKKKKTTEKKGDVVAGTESYIG